MKHISIFDGCTYEISYSMSMEGNGKQYDDDITLIWRDAPCGIDVAWEEDIPPRELVGWYFGEYDFVLVEGYIKDYYKAKWNIKEQPVPKKPKTMDLPICYVNFIADCLDAIKKHNLYALLSGECDPECAKDHLDTVLTQFCEPLFEYDDTVIILEEDE